MYRLSGICFVLAGDPDLSGPSSSDAAVPGLDAIGTIEAAVIGTIDAATERPSATSVAVPPVETVPALETVPADDVVTLVCMFC